MSKMTTAIALSILMFLCAPHSGYSEAISLNHETIESHPWKITLAAEQDSYNVGDYRRIMLNVTWHNSSDDEVSVDTCRLVFTRFDIKDQDGNSVDVMGESSMCWNSPWVTIPPNESHTTQQRLFQNTIPLNLKPGTIYIKNPGWFFSKEFIPSNTVEIQLSPGQSKDLTEHEKKRAEWDEFNRDAIKRLREKSHP